jgi:hypothetical protein
LPGMTLEALALEYALDPDRAPVAERRAQKLCAPCCHIVVQNPVKYCDAVSVAGETYCAAHRKPGGGAKPAQGKQRFGLLRAKITPWRSREWA